MFLYACIDMITLNMRSNADVSLVEVDSYFDSTYKFNSDK